MIRITAKQDGFRRLGLVHAGTREYADDRFTPEQLAILQAEPMLVVEERRDAAASSEGNAAEKEKTPAEADPRVKAEKKTEK